MTFVKDTTEGFVRVGLCDNVIGQAVNLGVGEGFSVGTVVKTILKIMGKEDMTIEQDPARVRPEKSEVMRLVSDNKLAKDSSGWEPNWLQAKVNGSKIASATSW